MAKATASTPPADQAEQQPVAVTNNMQNFDHWKCRIKKVVKEDKRTRQQWTEIENFELFRKYRTVRIEPQTATDFNAFAKGIPDADSFGDLYLPEGKFKQADIVSYYDIYPDESADDNMFRVIPSGQPQ